MPEALGRLRRRPEFLRVGRSRRKCVTPGLILQVAPAPHPPDGPAGPRVGLTASRKVGGAVARNRARRRLRAAAREVLPRQARKDLDYVLIARRETLSRPWAELLADLERALRRLGAARPDGGAGHPPRRRAPRRPA